MNNDIIDFYQLNVIDTCSIWNLLSSKTLLSTTKQTSISFCITNFVLYECIYKRRKKTDLNQNELIKRFNNERKNNNFVDYPISISDLQDNEILYTRKKRSKGEISSMIFAKKTNQAFITDDKNARHLADSFLGSDRVQTIPQLFGYCVYCGLLLDNGIHAVISEHKDLEDSITVHLESAYKKALEKRLM